MNHGPVICLDLPSKIADYLREDGLDQNLSYLHSLPQHPVKTKLKIKSDLLLSGLPVFWEVFKALSPKISHQEFHDYEGKWFSSGSEISFPEMPFGVAISGERVALNLLQRSTAVSTHTHVFAKKARPHGIKIVDTRKTTPGLRWLEKYAVKMGGGENHRFTQTDQWMIKDNHKFFWKGIQGAHDFFKSIGQPYKNTILEIHSIDEYLQAISLDLRFFLLDNFSPDKIKELVKHKVKGHFFEVSGGINENNIDQYLISGVDAISIGRITQFPASVDLSFKIQT
jgi:nicotinate-nucleotide pyrophosphorylase (carboxylating)